MLIVFRAANAPGTKESWCSDCRLACPVLYSALEGTGCVIIECNVGDKPT